MSKYIDDLIKSVDEIAGLIHNIPDLEKSQKIRCNYCGFVSTNSYFAAKGWNNVVQRTERECKDDTIISVMVVASCPNCHCDRVSPSK